MSEREWQQRSFVETLFKGNKKRLIRSSRHSFILVSGTSPFNTFPTYNTTPPKNDEAHHSIRIIFMAYRTESVVVDGWWCMLPSADGIGLTWEMNRVDFMKHYSTPHGNLLYLPLNRWLWLLPPLSHPLNRKCSFPNKIIIFIRAHNDHRAHQHGYQQQQP